MDYKPEPYAAEKYSIESPPPLDSSRVVEEKGIRIGEAAELYGDIASAEEYGYVSRGYATWENHFFKYLLTS